MKRTNMTAYAYGRHRRVYEDADGNLYFRFDGHLHGTFREYCISDDSEAEGGQDHEKI